MFEQVPGCNGKYLNSELKDILQSCCDSSRSGYNNVDWFVDEVIKLKNKTFVFHEKTKKDNIMTDENEEDFKNSIICRFSQKSFLSNKVTDHCHLTGKYRSPAEKNCSLNIARNKGFSFFFLP